MARGNLNTTTLLDEANDKMIAVQYPGDTNTWYYFGTANDSDVTLTVGAGERWDVDYIHFELAATATVGNRVLWIVVKDSASSVIWTSPKGANTAASTTSVLEAYIGAAYTTTAASVPTLLGATPTNALRVPMPILSLNAGFTIQIYDSAAIDAAADDVKIAVHYAKYK